MLHFTNLYYVTAAYYQGDGRTLFENIFDRNLEIYFSVKTAKGLMILLVFHIVVNFTTLLSFLRTYLF